MKKFIPLILVFTIILLVLPRSAKFNYDYRKGAPWKHETLIAQFDFPILKTEDELMEERRQAAEVTIPYYKYQEDIVTRNLRSAETMELGEWAGMRTAVVSALRDVYGRGVVGDDGIAGNSDIIYIQKDKRAAARPASEVLRLADARNAFIASVSAECPGVNADSVLRALSVDELVVPNLNYDRLASEQLNSDASISVSPTSGYVSAGQLIVSQDEIVTAEIAQMISSYEKEYSANIGSSTPGLLFWLGNAIIALVLVTFLYFAIRLVNPTVFTDSGKYLYLTLIFTVFTVLAIVIPRTHPEYLCAIPFVLCALLLEAFFDDRLVAMAYCISMLPLLLFAESGRMVFTMFVAGGVVSMMTFKHLNKGWRQFLNAFITFVVLLTVFLGFRLTELTGGNILRMTWMLLISSFLCVAGYPLSYLFEKIFNLVSVYRLNELCDTSSPLLRELEQKAPGTFQHSLQVMNMADAVAGAIGANVQLVRAGALYHDIGKILNPMCFVENESMLLAEGMQRYHDGLSPMQSAQDIIKHITDGDELAQKHRLPNVIRAFILSHHGTTVVSYFYDRFLKAGGSPAERGEFTYPGIKPVTKEQTILMLCDSVEAASRSLKEYTPEAFDAFVEGIVDGKMEEGQFEDAEISVKDLGIVKNSLKNYLAQMYHGRVAYPNKKNKLIGILK
ncbi:MAG: HDIG domain-containing protein [Bacteroidales bacterium]|nr:HDIG domain-containing protein [Bacteroidales bacterium]